MINFTQGPRGAAPYVVFIYIIEANSKLWEFPVTVLAVSVFNFLAKTVQAVFCFHC